MKKFTLLLFLFSIWGAAYAQVPDISVDTDTLRDVLANGATSTQSFTISNNGDTTLHWSINLENLFGSGPEVSFLKKDNTSWTLSENQDRISNSVWITRDLTQSLFNAKSEASYATGSPEGTSWALGGANETVPDSAFADFVTAHGGKPGSLVGNLITLYLVDEEIYHEVEFASFTSGGGGGFEYTRRQMMPWFDPSEFGDSLLKGESVTIDVAFDASILTSKVHFGAILISSNDPDSPLDTVVTELDILAPGVIHIVETEIVDTLIAGNSTTFELNIENSGLADLTWNANNFVIVTKANLADWTLEENQDRITDDVWITRRDKEGLFNIAQENSYDRNGDMESPVGTQWAYGKTADVAPGDYTTWRQSFRNRHSTTSLVGKTLSLKIVDEEIYFDVEFNQWSQGNGAGGFSYTRTSPIPNWISGTMEGTVPGDDASVVTFMLDAADLNNGVFTFDLEIRSNDAEQPLILVPVTLTVLGTSEISTDASYDYGDVFYNVSSTYVLPVENTGSNVLNITSIATDSAEFVPLKKSLNLQPGAKTTVQVVFTPSRLGFIRDTIRIASNDPGSPLTKVVIEGTGIDLPAISLSSYSFDDAVMKDTITTDTIVMTNTGETDLEWSISSTGGITYDESGFLFSFTKMPDANIDLAVNRDSINENVSLTRDNDGGLYDYNGNNIEWALGTTNEALNSNIHYDSDWRDAMDDKAADLPGRTISLHIVDDDVYVDINILSWGSRYSGTGCSYTRSAPMYYWLSAENLISGDAGTLPPDSSQKIVITHDASGLSGNAVFEGAIVLNTNVPSQPEVVISNSLTVDGINPEIGIDTAFLSATLIADGLATREFTITNEGNGKLFWQLGEPVDTGAAESDKVVFFKHNDSDWTREEFQDRITDLVWITRADNRGLFNIAQESEYDRDGNTSPAGTEWAYGYTVELSPDDYGTWYSLHNQSTPEIVGQPISLHLIEEDIYFDILFTGWQMNDGGGFSYIRSEPSLPTKWSSSYPLRGTLSPGSSQVVEVTFDPVDQIGGMHTSEMILSSNDDENPETIITLSFEVIGNPEIRLPESQLEFGNVYLGYPQSLELTIENKGNAVLNISDIEFDNSDFSVVESALEVPPYDEVNLIVSLDPASLIAYAGIMTIHSDDPHNPTVEVSLSGQGVIAPQVAVNMPEISGILFSGEVATQQFVITNSGLSDLDWYLGPNEVEITFSKKSSDDFRLAEYQDRINDDVWITRGTREGLFNIAQENSYDRNGNWESPLGTEWAYGLTSEVEPSDYTEWRDAVRNRANIQTHELPGRTFSMKLTETETYWDVTFLEWERRAGGFSYIRRFAQGTINKSWVTFSNEAGSLQPGQSDTITVTFNPNANIPAGEFIFGMAVWSNDPKGPVFVPVSLNIDDIVSANPIPDTLVQKGFIGFNKDVSTIFLSKTNNDIVYTAFSSNEMVATVEIIDTILTVTETGTGITEITIMANSQFGESGNQTFELRVNDIPVASEIQDVRYPDGFTSADIDISELFADSDVNDLTITTSSSDETVVTALIADGILTLTEVASGFSTITLIADDGFGGIDTTHFEARVNSAPVVVNPISDVVIEENFITNTIDLSAVFEDVDMDPLLFSASSSNEDVVLSFSQLQAAMRMLYCHSLTKQSW